MPVLFRYPQEFKIMQYCDCATHENDIKVRRLNSQTHENDIKVRMLNSQTRENDIKVRMLNSQTHENDIKVRILNSHSNSQIIKTVWFVTFGVMMLNTTFNNISVISYGGQFYWWRKSKYPEKTTDLSQVTDTT
jgi:hypothetical protein